MENKFFSIITPVYNGEKHIESTITSVINQTFKGFEYIIMDGDSTDNTFQIINKYNSKIDKIISEKDNGMYDAIDKAIKISKGKYIIWINSDDLLADQNTLEKVFNFLTRFKAEWITGRVSFYYDKKDKLFSFIPYVYPNFIIKRGWAHDCIWGFVQQESTIFSKDLYLKVGGFDKNIKMAGDFYLWKKFSKVTNLISCNIKIGIQRKWQGQMQKDLNFYYSELNKNKCSLKIIKILRLLYSLLFYPLIYFRK